MERCCRRVAGAELRRSPAPGQTGGGGVAQRRLPLIDNEVSMTKLNGKNGPDTVCREPRPVPCGLATLMRGQPRFTQNGDESPRISRSQKR